MKNKHLLPIVLAAAMVLTGVFAPRFFLNQSEERLLHAAGGRDGKEIAIYQGQHGKNELAERISKLTAVISQHGYSNDLLKGQEARKPLDSELSMTEAREAVTHFYDTVQNNGKDLAQFPELYHQSVEAIPYQAHFATHKEDLSLSFWINQSDKNLVILDAVSGVPILCNLIAETESDNCGIKDLYRIAARTYNARYADVLGVSFPEEAEISAGPVPCAMAEGSSGPYALAVIQSSPGYPLLQIYLTVRIDNSDTTS